MMMMNSDNGKLRSFTSRRAQTSKEKTDQLIKRIEVCPYKKLVSFTKTIDREGETVEWIEEPANYCDYCFKCKMLDQDVDHEWE